MLKAKKKWVAVSLIIAILFVMINYPTHDKSSKAETQNAIEFFVTPAPSTIPVPSATVAPLATPYYDYGVSNPTISNGVTTWDCVYFGNYWQNDTNGDGTADQQDDKEPIKWRVLSVDGSDAFLMADQCLDTQPYNEENEDVTWETCTLRTWLNDTEKEGSFVWSSGEKVTYTNWEPNEPNDYGDGEDYGQIRRKSGQWNDNSIADLSCGFVMELPFDVEKVNSTLLGGLNQVLAKWLHKDDSFAEESKQPEETQAKTPETSAAPSQTPSSKESIDKMADSSEEDDVISDDIEDDDFVFARKITIKNHSGYYKIKRLRLKATVDKKASIKKITWSSSNKKYVSVNSKGKLTIKKAGIGKTVSITAKAMDGSRVQKVLKVKVIKKAGKRFLIKLKK